jgi:hypothetical protein
MRTESKAGFTNDADFDVVGLSGAGVTYLFKRSSPSPFVAGGVGLGVGGSLAGSDAESGPGFSVGGGFEFRRHLTVSGDAMFVRLGSGQNHTVFKASFDYLFY